MDHNALTTLLLGFGSVFGGIVGVLVAVTKLVPERAKLILGYQVEAIGSLQKENKRLLHLVRELETRVKDLENSLEKANSYSLD